MHPGLGRVGSWVRHLGFGSGGAFAAKVVPPIAGGVNMLGGAGRVVLVRRCSVVETRYSACPFGFYPFTDTLLVCAASRMLLVRRRSAMR